MIFPAARPLLFVLLFTAAVGIAASCSSPEGPDIFPQARLAGFDVPHGLSPEQLALALPAIRTNACLEAQAAARTVLRPARVGFEPCSAGAGEVTISADLQDISVSGVADLGNEKRKFLVLLQHYPPAIWAGGFIVLDVRL